MAKSTDISYRYANAWLDAADELDLLKQVREEIGDLQSLIHDSEELADFLKDRSIPRDAKQRILSEMFEEKLQGITHNFLLLLVSKQRERLLAEILEACRMILDERDGIVNVEVTSAVALSSAQKDLLKTKLESYTGKHIRMQTRVNPDIIGGFAVRVGDLVFDSSLAVQLQQMRHALIG